MAQQISERSLEVGLAELSEQLARLVLKRLESVWLAQLVLKESLARLV